MRKAFLIACDEFHDREAFTRLRYPRSDSEALRILLLDPRYCYFDEVELLINPSQHVARRALERMTRAADSADLILFYYNGHGKLDRDGSLALILPETEYDYLDASSIGSGELKRLFNLSRAGQKVILLDCCYGGAIGAEGLKGDADGVIASLVEGARGTFVLTASTKFQPAYESQEVGGSALTSSLIEGVRTGGAASNDSTEITLSQLAAYVRNAIGRNGAQQPQFWDIGSTGELIFSRKPARSDAAWRRRATKMMSQFHTSNDLDDDLVEELGAIIRSPDGPDDATLQLLDALLKREIGVGLFVKRWLVLKNASLVKVNPAGNASEVDVASSPATTFSLPESPIESEGRIAAVESVAPQDELPDSEPNLIEDGAHILPAHAILDVSPTSNLKGTEAKNLNPNATLIRILERQSGGGKLPVYGSIREAFEKTEGLAWKLLLFGAGALGLLVVVAVAKQFHPAEADTSANAASINQCDMKLSEASKASPDTIYFCSYEQGSFNEVDKNSAVESSVSYDANTVYALNLDGKTIIEGGLSPYSMSFGFGGKYCSDLKGSRAHSSFLLKENPIDLSSCVEPTAADATPAAAADAAASADSAANSAAAPAVGAKP